MRVCKRWLNITSNYQLVTRVKISRFYMNVAKCYEPRLLITRKTEERSEREQKVYTHGGACKQSLPETPFLPRSTLDPHQKRGMSCPPVSAAPRPSRPFLRARRRACSSSSLPSTTSRSCLPRRPAPPRSLLGARLLSALGALLPRSALGALLPRSALSFVILQFQCHNKN